MRRTNPNPGPSKGGHNLRIVHTQHLTDHAGAPLIRARYDKPERPIPANFIEKPVFVFQVYSTIDLGLNEIEESATKRARTASPTDRTNLFELLTYFTCSLETAQKASPIFEFYENPLPDALAMVEHQRREIQHRKAQSHRQDVLQIPKVTHSMWDSRKHGFLIAINSDGFKMANQQSSFDPNGPLWVTFDRRRPAASSVEIRKRLDCDDSQALKADEMIEVYPEKLEIESQRKQQRPMDMDLGYMYSKSYRMPFAEDDTPSESPPMDYAQDEDEVGAESEEIVLASDQLPELEGFTIQRDDATVVVKTKDLNGDATLRYLVYAQYLANSNIEALESAAKRFTAALMETLPEGTTLDLQFHIPQQPTLSSVLQSYKSSPNAQSNLECGALTSSTLISTRTVEEQFTESAPPLSARIHPISQQPEMFANDPRTSQCEPYRTFLVVLDKPDFVRLQAGVLFLLTDGGKQKSWPSWRPQNAPELDYTETHVWRSAGMREVAERLAMVFRPQEPPSED